MEARAILQALNSGAISLELAEEKLINLKTKSAPSCVKPPAVKAIKAPAQAPRPSGMADQPLDILPDWLKDSPLTVFRPENLGNPLFQTRYQCRLSYFAGSMFRGISSVAMVVAMARAGLLSFFGSAGLDGPTVEGHIHEIQRQLGPQSPYGMCLINNINNPREEQAHAEQIVRNNLPVVEAAAFSSITPSLVYCRIKGLRCQDGKHTFARRLIAKCSRLEIARMFLSPPPSDIVAQLLAANRITTREAELAQSIPMADDLAVEADSGGHTDQGTAFALIPAMLLLRDEMQRNHRYPREIMVGCGGGIGTPQAVAAAFMLGADFIFTGSINQCTVESGTHPRVKDLLATLSIHDTTMAVAGDMFEIGAKVQVVKRGTRFAARANRLHQLFLQYNNLEQIPAAIRKQLETRYFRRTFEQVWDEVRAYKGAKQGARIAEAEQNPRLKLILIFKWFFAHTNELARNGDEAGKDNWQIHCGPALGAFNQWSEGSHLEKWSNRHVDQIAMALMEASCQHMQKRLNLADSCGSSSKEAAPRRNSVSNRVPGKEIHAYGETGSAIAIIGMAGQFPQSEDVAAFWENIAAGRHCICEIPAERWPIDKFFDPNPQTPGKTYCRWMGAMPYADRFDPLFFNISPAEAEVMDPQQRLFLQHCWHCVEDAGLSPTALSGSRLGVFTGCTAGDYSRLAQEQQLNAQGLLGGASSILSARISYMLNLKGPSVSIDTACSSSLVALAQACDSLLLGNCDMALAGGVYVISGPAVHIMAAKAGVLSFRGRCHTFDARADGFVPGEGVGVVLLKRLREAVHDRDPIHAVIRGWGINQDGKTNGITAPSVSSQILLEKEVFHRFKIDPETITLVEAHGTATRLGDPIEVEALTEAFTAFTDKKNYCALGSLKSNIGHLMTSAGIAGLIKVVMALKHRQLPPTINYEQLNPHMELKDGPFYINTRMQPWKTQDGSLRCGSVGSFGFSGTNAFAVIEEYQPAHDRTSARINVDTNVPEIFILSAKNEKQLDEYIRWFQRYLKTSDSRLDDIVYTLQVGRDAMPWRFACVVNSKDSLEKALQAGLDKQTLPYVFKNRIDKVLPGAPEEEGRIIPDLILRQSYRQLAHLWVRGRSVDWKLLYKDRPVRRIHLPVYPFARERYWLEWVNPSPESPQKNIAILGKQGTNNETQHAGDLSAEKADPELGVLCWVPCWKEKLPGKAKKNGASPKRIIFICDSGSDLNHRLLETHIKDSKVLALQSKEKRIDARYTHYAGLILEEIQKVMKSKNGRVLIQFVLRVKGEAILFTGLFGIIQTACLENPGIFGQLIQIDTDISTNTLLRLLQENDTAPEDRRVRYSSDLRQIHYWQSMNRKSGQMAMPWTDQGVYLITGGLGGLGLIFAREIARKTKNSTLILSGRRPPDPAIEAQFEAENATGVHLIYQPCDIGSPGDVNRLIQSILQNYGRLHGVLHGAGVVCDNFLIKKTHMEVRQVFHPKVAGLVNLDRASRDVALDFFICFSSGAGVMGNVGQADYAAANAFMDAYAGYRNALVADKKRFGRTLSINWPYWQDGGMQIDTVTAQTMRQKAGAVAMPTADGLEAFYRSWQSGRDQVMVMFGEVNRMSSVMGDVGPAGSGSKAARDCPAAGGSYDADRLKEQTNARLRQLLSGVIKLDASRIDVHEPLESYGIDSLMINRLNSALAEIFGELSKTLFFEFQTLAALSAYLVDEHNEACLKWNGVKRPQDPGRPNEKHSLAKQSCFTRPADPEANTAGQAVSTTCQGQRGSREPIAIIGMSGSYPQAPDLPAFWNNLKKGRDCITEIPADRWPLQSFFEPDPQKAVTEGKSYSKWGGFIDRFADFDPAFFNISPREAINMDPQERLFITACWQAVEDAGYTKVEIAKRYDHRVGVFAGITKTGFELYGPHLWQQGKAIYPHTSFASVANRISYLMNLKGPSMPIDTMCSSSLTAIHEACEKLYSGECEMAIAGGVNLYLHPSSYVFLCSQQMLSKDRRNRSFGLGGDGFVPGEGVGVVLLKPLSKALADQDRIYAVIRGTAVNHGGKTNGYTVPNPAAQTEVILEAMKKAGVDARHVSYIEAHGTGTELGDPIEITGLTQAFRKYTTDLKFCAIGSVKSNLGHLEAAAGIAGLTKIILQMQHRQLVPSLHTEALNPNIDFSRSPFHVQRKLCRWEQPEFNNKDGKLYSHRIAGISSFGAGGANAHVVLEEYRPLDRRSASVAVSAAEPAIIVLSAHTDTQLKMYARSLVRFIRQNRHRVPDCPPETRKVGLLPALVQMTAELLRVEPAEIDPHGSIGDFGFDPVLLASLTEKINTAFDLTVSVERFREHNSLSDMADHLNEAFSDKSQTRNAANDRSTTPWDLSDMAFTLQTGREAFDCRLALITSSIDDLESKLLGFIEDGKEQAEVFAGTVDRCQKILPVLENDAEWREASGNWMHRRKWDKLLKLWVQGLSVDWRALYNGDKKHRRMHLPTYPFQMQRFWAPEKEMPTSGPATVKDRVQHLHQIPLRLGGDRMLLQETSAKAVCPKPQGLALTDPKEFECQLAGPEDVKQEENAVITPSSPYSGIEPATSANEVAQALTKQITPLSIRSTGQPVENPASDSTSIDNESLLARLSAVLAETLFMAPDSIDAHKQFADMGMDSILAVEWLKQVNAIYGTAVEVTRIYDFPTLRRFAVYLAEEIRRTTRPNAAQMKTVNENRPVEAVHSIEIRQKPDLPSKDVPVAVIGMSGRYPMAENLTEFWENLRAGKNCIQEVPQERWNAAALYDPVKGKPGKICSKWGGFIKDVDKFDAEFFNLSPQDARGLHPEVRLFMQIVWEAVEDAGYTREEFDRQNKEKGLKTGVFVGCMYQQYPWLAGDAEFCALLGGSSYWAIANRISYFMNFKGPSVAVDTACSSSLTAIHLACQSIQRNECAMALAGGVNLNLHAAKYIGIADAGALGSQAKSMSMGDGDGMIPGEGVGAVFLKALPQAVHDNDRIYGIIKASAMGHYGTSNGFAAPDANAQAELIADVITKSGIDPSSIQYVDVAANGAALGDAIEIKGLIRAYRRFTTEKDFCGIGSVKSNIGHLEAASGISQLTKVLLQLKYKHRVPTLNAEPLNPSIRLVDSPFFIQKNACDWKTGRTVKNGTKGHPRRAAVSSFGGGGSMVHLILEESSNNGQVDCCTGPSDTELFVFSARDKEGLETLVGKIKHFLEQTEAISLAAMAHTLRHGREPMPARLALTAQSKTELMEKLSSIIRGQVDVPGIYTPQRSIRPELSQAPAKTDNPQNFIAHAWDKKDWETIARIWVAGTDINWRLLSARSSCQMISLPGYPFKKIRYWIEASDDQPDIQKQANVMYLQDHALKEISNEKSSFRNQTYHDLQVLVAHFLGMTEIELDLDKSLHAYGFDSIKATKLKYKIEAYYRHEIPMAIFGDSRTLKELLKRLAGILDLGKMTLKASPSKDPVIDLDRLDEAELTQLMEALNDDLSRPETA